jgi:type I restriction enzyme, R subunit
LKAALGRAVTYAEERSVRPDDVLGVSGFDRQAALQRAAEKLLGSDEDKRTFLRLVGDAWALFRAVLPDPAANAFRGDMVVLKVVGEMIRTMTRKQPGKSALAAIAEIERLIGQAIAGAAITAPLPTGEDMERYNAGTMDVERLFEELTAFTRTLDEKEKRHLKEGLDANELAVFDILTRPDPKLTKAEELEVKKIARELLAKLKREKFILDWRLEENAKADVRETIRQQFDILPPPYDERI